eukprot:666842-Rhodomonas_salina.1
MQRPDMDVEQLAQHTKYTARIQKLWLTSHTRHCIANAVCIASNAAKVLVAPLERPGVQTTFHRWAGYAFRRRLHASNAGAACAGPPDHPPDSAGRSPGGNTAVFSAKCQHPQHMATSAQPPERPLERAWEVIGKTGRVLQVRAWVAKEEEEERAGERGWGAAGMAGRRGRRRAVASASDRLGRCPPVVESAARRLSLPTRKRCADACGCQPARPSAAQKGPAQRQTETARAHACCRRG